VTLAVKGGERVVSANSPSPDYSTKGFVTYFAFFDVGDQGRKLLVCELLSRFYVGEQFP
jgi:hypothetical protein